MDLLKEFKCKCGQIHNAKIEDVIVENGAINKIPAVLKKNGLKKPFLVFDCNTFFSFGSLIEKIFNNNGIAFSEYVFQSKRLEPDERAVGSVFMHFDLSCDVVIGVGSGVINDICKILSNRCSLFYIIVATAPSMDGYASTTSSMAMDGLKVSLPSKCANVIIGDLDILKTAPLKMLKSGLGDMLAKYVSILEWRISNIINDEYYCEEIASLIRNAVKKCVDNADKLLDRDEEAVKAVFEGLILGGVAMNYAGCSRPASGVEHYFSHIWDMRALEFNTPFDFHGIQCAIGTLYAIKVYEKIKTLTPDKDKALEYVKNFDYGTYKKSLKNLLGKSADQMIKLEEKEGKYDKEKHKVRLEIVLSKWQEIVKIIDEELMPKKDFIKLLDALDMPKTCGEIGIDDNNIFEVFCATKDIRDKYVLSRLCWDLGIILEVKEILES